LTEALEALEAPAAEALEAVTVEAELLVVSESYSTCNHKRPIRRSASEEAQEPLPADRQEVRVLLASRPA
jgi:hypothetical protein